LARSLAQRGIARDVIDDALAALPDDEFARRSSSHARKRAPCAGWSVMWRSAASPDN
jgi:hypothetical protein